jgi:hypothetical protein
MEWDCIDQGHKRLPNELERRFFDVFYLIVTDWWFLPAKDQWIDILNKIGTFAPENELLLDTSLRDCYKFFLKVSQLLNFEGLFL